jgi:pyruvate formate lyase activating enzyme
LDDLDCIATLTGLSRERTEKYASSLKQSLEVLRGAKVRIWIRVIPGYVTLDKVERLGDQIAGTATEVYLIQFLSVPENDAPFDGIDTPSPAEGEMVAMARRLLEFVPNVYVRGRDFKSDFRAGRQ